jgi:hypothetical protein
MRWKQTTWQKSSWEKNGKILATRLTSYISPVKRHRHREPPRTRVRREGTRFLSPCRLERSRWRGGRCDSDTSDIMGFNCVLNHPSPLAVISLVFCLLRTKVDSISNSLTASAANASGFLQVAVSEAPSQSACELELLRAGAPDTALRLSGTDPVRPQPTTRSFVMCTGWCRPFEQDLHSADR